ncbi:hypothetical protein GCM10007868_11990 [Gluconobacter frateurii]|uniref:Uncharacterized protein n=1 Tax=Gluconobacter frateurii NRIC 0228 TaxID=1307946 RepID=A0ABQ0QDJ0_9PROT|nr:hypothetical protein AA0228_2327 [Gluconobacter frateurii NRIC 0228]GLP90124.1 hypothetical protein GCM10007868_11990 [Gluconobacter frateurii]
MRLYGVIPMWPQARTKFIYKVRGAGCSPWNGKAASRYAAFHVLELYAPGLPKAETSA